MRHLTNLAIVLSLFTLSCSSTKKTEMMQATTQTDEIVFTLAKSSGRGINPAYSLKVFESGKVIYNGFRNIDRVGKYKTQLNKNVLDNLKDEFNKSNFFSFENNYTARITDLPTTHVSFTQNSKTKKVRDYYGAPAELKKLEKLLEKLVEDGDWVKVN